MGLADADPSVSLLRPMTPRASVREQRSREFADLTWPTVHAILQKADRGDIRDLVDLWERMLLSDDHLQSVWVSRTSPLISAPWEISAGKSDSDDLERPAAMLAEACQSMLLDCQPEHAFTALLNGIGVPLGVVEVIWGRGRIHGQPAYVFRSLRGVHPRRFRIDDYYEAGLYDDGQAFAALSAAGLSPEHTDGDVSGRIVRLPTHKYVVHQPSPIHTYPTRHGLVRAVVRHWWIKTIVIRYWLNGAEVSGNPRVLARVEQATESATMDELIDELETMAADGVLVAREGLDLSLIPVDLKPEIWDRLYTRCDAAISKAVLGSTLSVENTEAYGSRSQAETQAEQTVDPRREADSAAMWASLERQLFRSVRDLNPHLFPPATPLPVGRHRLYEEPVEIDAISVDAGVVTANELRMSRGLQPWEDGRGDQIAQQAIHATGITEPAPEVAASDPFPPSRRRAIAETLRAPTETSGPSTRRSVRPLSES